MRHIFLKSLGVIVLLAGAPTLMVVGQNSGNTFKAHDPGPRPNPQTLVPNPEPGLDENETALFNESLLRSTFAAAVRSAYCPSLEKCKQPPSVSQTGWR
jgi:hypothetical protein